MQTLGIEISTLGSIFCQQKGQPSTATFSGIVPTRNHSSCMSKRTRRLFLYRLCSQVDIPHTRTAPTRMRTKTKIRRGAVEVFLCRAEGGRASLAQSWDSAGSPFKWAFSGFMTLHTTDFHNVCPILVVNHPTSPTDWTDTQELQEFWIVPVSCFAFFYSGRGVHAWSSRFSRRRHVLATDPERGSSVKSLSDRQDKHN